MAEQVTVPKPATSFEYELFEGDPERLRTVVATPTQAQPWIDPASLKLKHRIGRGPFGDVWLATHHQSADDFDEYHEVAVKTLLPLTADCTKTFIDKFEELFMKCRELQGVCWLHGISVINGKICIAMKFYEGSLGNRIAQLKGGKLPLPDILRYGSQTWNPNYMAPEQWEPEVRGPISLETDTWGFGCSIVEMLTGIQPWFGKSIDEIYRSVVIKQEKPFIPSGLPPAVENVINGCFEYDLRSRPLMADILHAFESSQNAVYSDGEWIGLGSRALIERPGVKGYTAWYLLKDHLQVGDTVRSRKPHGGRRPQSMDVPEGTVVGLDSGADRTSFVLVKIPGMHNPLRVQESTLERVTCGFAVGDWVCLKEENKKHSSIGILHSVQRDGRVAVGFIGLETVWTGNSSEIQMAKAYYVGQFVKLKANIFTPRFEWPRKREGEWATGKILQVLPNGCLVVGFPGRFVFGQESNSFLADPAEVELVSFETCPGVVKKYQHIEDHHWSVRPLAIALSLFTAMKLGLFVGRSVSAKLKKGWRNSARGDGHCQDVQTNGNAAWLPSPVANIIFREGTPTTAAAR